MELVEVTTAYGDALRILGVNVLPQILILDLDGWEAVVKAAPKWALMSDSSIMIDGIEYIRPRGAGAQSGKTRISDGSLEGAWFETDRPSGDGSGLLSGWE